VVSRSRAPSAPLCWKLGKKVGTGVGEHDFGDQSLAFEIAVAAVIVPVTDAPTVLQITERVLVAAPPRIEVVEILRIEILAILLMAATSVTIGGDDGVVRVQIVRIPGGLRHCGGSLRVICEPNVP